MRPSIRTTNPHSSTTSRLNADWRERAEDIIWSLINSPEFLIVP